MSWFLFLNQSFDRLLSQNDAFHHYDILNNFCIWTQSVSYVALRFEPNMDVESSLSVVGKVVFIQILCVILLCCCCFLIFSAMSLFC